MKKLGLSIVFATLFAFGMSAQTAPAAKPKTEPVPAATKQPATTTQSGTLATQQPTTTPTAKRGNGPKKAQVRMKKQTKPVAKVPASTPAQKAPAAK